MSAEEEITDVVSESELLSLCPLAMPEVLHVLFGFLNPKDLVNCRLVCTVWNDEGCRLLGKKLILKIRSINELQDFCELMIAYGPNNAYKQIELDCRWPIIILLGKPCYQVLFESCGTQLTLLTLQVTPYDRTYISLEDFQEILFRFCPNLKSLVLRGLPIIITTTHNSFQFPNENPSALVSLPKLKNLLIHILCLYDDSTFLKDIFRRVPNLESIQMSMENCLVTERTIQCLTDVRSMGYLTKLTSLSLMTSTFYNSDVCELLFKMNVEFKRLVLFSNFSSMLKIVDSSKNTLELLVLQDYPDWKQHGFPFMKNLKKLIIQESLFPLIFFRQMPQLHTLILRNRNVSIDESFNSYSPLTLSFPDGKEESKQLTEMQTSTSILNDNRFIHHGLVTLQFSPTATASNVEDIRKIGDTFVNLKHLTIHGNDAITKVIYDHFPKLEDLIYTEFDDLTDLTVTGGLENISNPISKDETNECSQEVEIQPNITSLKFLKRLELREGGAKSVLTDVSIIHGILKAEKLASLFLHIPGITEAWVDAISTETMPYLLRLTVIHPTLDMEPFELLRKRMPRVEVTLEKELTYSLGRTESRKRYRRHLINSTYIT